MPAKIPWAINVRMTSLTVTPSRSARSLTTTCEGMVTGPVGLGGVATRDWEPAGAAPRWGGPLRPPPPFAPERCWLFPPGRAPPLPPPERPFPPDRPGAPVGRTPVVPAGRAPGAPAGRMGAAPAGRAPFVPAGRMPVAPGVPGVFVAGAGRVAPEGAVAGRAGAGVVC